MGIFFACGACSKENKTYGTWLAALALQMIANGMSKMDVLVLK